MLGGGSNQNSNLMMYAVVLQNAAEEARFLDHERRMRNQLNQNENEEEDESMHENENVSHIEEAVAEEEDPAANQMIIRSLRLFLFKDFQLIRATMMISLKEFF